MLKSKIVFVALIASVGVFAGQAQTKVHAQEAPKSVGQFQDWTAYTFAGPNGKSCYALSTPKDKQPKGINRDPIYLFVTHRPTEKVRNEISVVNGYTFKEGGKTSYQVRSSKGNASFEMFTKDDTAWLKNIAEQGSAIDKMKQGKDIVVQGISTRGTNTTDTYSLNGISKALDKINAECK